MNVELAKVSPGQGKLTVQIEITSEMNVSAFSARQKVTGFVADRISTNLAAGEPVLHVGDRICWNVPVILSLPPQGDLGEVGVIQVDVATGQLFITQSHIEEIIRRAAELAGRTTPAATAAS